MHSARAYEERVGSTITVEWTGTGRTFRIERLLGWGSTSAVYEATAEGAPSAGRVALKILHPHLHDNRAVVARFLREVRITKTVVHRAIVPVRAEGKGLGTAFLVLDLLEGETLEDRRLRAGGRLPIDVVGPIADELMSALAAVHANGVVHRDVKPQNVFLTTANEVKLLDFGTARVVAPEDGPVSVDGLVIGTPSFMAPEQARGERSAIDALSDVWSMGATLFTLLSGEYVHVEKEAHQRLLSAGTRAARSLASVGDVGRRLSPSVVACVDRALAFEKSERFPDITAMRTALAW